MHRLLKGRHFLTLLDYTPEEILFLLDLARDLKVAKKSGAEKKQQVHKNIVLFFEKDSTRTRCSFEVAGMDIGFGVTYIPPAGSHIGKKESIVDTARVFGTMYDGIAYRGYEQKTLEDISKHAGVPVWNALTNEFHPTQVLADFMTIREKKQNQLQGIKLAFVGDARGNVGNSIMVGAAKMGLDFYCVAPRKLWPTQELVDECQKIARHTGARLNFNEDPMKGTEGVDVIYTDVWTSLGEPKEILEERIRLLLPYQVNMSMIKNAAEHVIFLHCLPSCHNPHTVMGKEIASKFGLNEMEVTDEVFESRYSCVFLEAENRLHTAKAIILATTL